MKRFAEIAASYEMLDRLFNTTDLAIAFLDPEFNFVRVNRAYAEGAGHDDVDYFKGRNHFELYPHEENEVIFRKVVTTGEPHFEYAKPFEYPDFPEKGVSFWDWSLQPVVNDDGEVENLVLSLVDVTRRVKNEIELKNMASLLEQQAKTMDEILSASPDCFFLVDRRGELIYASQDGAALFGLERDEIVGKPFRKIDFPKEDMRKIVRQAVSVLKTGHEAAGENHMLTAHGRRYIEYSLNPLHDMDGGVNAVVATLRDITLRKSIEFSKKVAEKELEKQRLMQINSDRLRSLGEMAAGMAHELYQPLAGTRALAEQMLLGFKRGWATSEEEIKENLELIIEQADRMAHVIEHIRLFARGADTPDVTGVDVNEVISSSSNIIEAQVKYKGLHIDFDLADDLPKVHANAFSLEEVILNLVSNASDAITSKRDWVSGDDNRINISSFKGNIDGKDGVVIRVTDTGRGIPKKILDRIFDPFFTTKSPRDGTGLGLAICKSITENFGGNIFVESSQGKGTSVSVRLNIAGDEREG